MHHMAEATIGFAPLNGLSKEVPLRAPIPTEVMVPTEPPTFAEQYGSMIYLIICVVIALYLIQPLLDSLWDINSEDDQWKFIAAYATYGFVCLAIFIFLVQPLF